MLRNIYFSALVIFGTDSKPPMDSFQFEAGDVKLSKSFLLRRREGKQEAICAFGALEGNESGLTNLTLYRCMCACLSVCCCVRAHLVYLLTGSDSPIKAYRDEETLKD